MAIAFSNSSNGSSTTGTSLTFSYTCGSGSNRILWVAVIGNSGANNSITGVTYNGVSMTLAASMAGGDRYSYLFYLVAPASGANNIVVSASTSTFMAAIPSDYEGASQTGVPDAFTTTTEAAATTSQTASVDTVADNCWVIGTNAGYRVGNVLPTAVSGCVRRGVESAFGTIGLFDSNSAKTPAGTVTFVTTRGNGANLSVLKLIMASFAPAAAGGFKAYWALHRSGILGSGVR